jgi:5-methylcytosine-specific restriction endonuclease McrA
MNEVDEVREDDANSDIGLDEGDLTLDTPSGPLNLNKNDRSLAELSRWHQRGRIIIDPEWQRKYVWDNKRASRLIESFLIDLPIPVIYLAINENGQYEVIDGLQRLTSVFNFFANGFALTGLEIQPDLNKKKLGELPPEIQAKLEDTTLRTFELAKNTSHELRFLIFERLNTGGMALNDMEIRNCLYRGSLNNLLKELAETDDFKNCVNQKGLDKRMQDRALLLRYLAFYERTYHKAKKGLKSFFNEFFETYQHAQEDKLKEFRHAFKRSMRACTTVFGDKAFRLRRIYEAKSQKGGEWTPRINATIFQVLAVSMADCDIGQITRSADRIREAYLDLISTDQRWVDAVSQSTGDPAKIEYSFSIWNERLRQALGANEPNDGQRIFSYALKEEMFAQDSTCSICGQRISLINDSALDHDIQYWRGGKTIPANARLAHRQCNWQRSKAD